MIIKIHKNTRPKSAKEWFALISAGLLAMIVIYSLFFPILGNEIFGIIILIWLFSALAMLKGTQFSRKEPIKT